MGNVAPVILNHRGQEVVTFHDRLRDGRVLIGNGEDKGIPTVLNIEIFPTQTAQGGRQDEPLVHARQAGTGTNGYVACDLKWSLLWKIKRFFPALLNEKVMQRGVKRLVPGY